MKSFLFFLIALVISLALFLLVDAALLGLQGLSLVYKG